MKTLTTPHMTRLRHCTGLITIALILTSCVSTGTGGAVAPPPTPSGTATPGAVTSGTGTVTATPSSGASSTPGAATSATATPAGGSPTVAPTLNPTTVAKNGGPPTTDDLNDGVAVDQAVPSGGGSNIVRIVNKVDSRLRVRGRIQLNKIPGPGATPANLAFAYGSCNNCQTFAVALQIDLISKTASNISPQNTAIALNYQCNNCKTVARALQYVYQVDDPTQVPDNVKDLINSMNKELNAIQSDPSSTFPDAETRVNNVIAQFQALATSLNDLRDEKTDATSPGAQPVGTVIPVTPSPTVTATPGASPSASPSVSPSATVSAMATLSASPTTGTGNATATTSSANAPTATIQPVAPTAMPTGTATVTSVPTPTVTATVTKAA